MKKLEFYDYFFNTGKKFFFFFSNLRCERDFFLNFSFLLL